MSHHHHHGHNGSNQSSSYGYGAPTYNYDPLQQAPAAPYGQQMDPVYGQPPSFGGYGQQVMPHQQPSGFGVYPGQELQYLQAEEHRHRQNEHRGGDGRSRGCCFCCCKLRSCKLHLSILLSSFGKHKVHVIRSYCKFWRRLQSIYASCFCLGIILDELKSIRVTLILTNVQMFSYEFQFEKHEEKVDPAHAHRHLVEAQIAEAAALGQGGYALYEHHEANQIYKQEPDLGGAHHHGHHHRH